MYGTVLCGRGEAPGRRLLVHGAITARIQYDHDDDDKGGGGDGDGGGDDKGVGGGGKSSG